MTRPSDGDPADPPGRPVPPRGAGGRPAGRDHPAGGKGAGGPAIPPGRRPASDPPRADTPHADEDPPADAAAPAAPEEEPEPSVDDQLRALGEHGADDTDLQDAIQAKLIAERVASRLQRDPSGMRIGNLALFNGSVTVGSGFHFSAPDGSPAAGARGVRRVDAARLAAQVERYLRPPRFDDALDRLWQHRLLVLAARQGTGRQTAALNLLAEVLAMSGDGGAEDGSCFHVTDIEAVADTDWKPPTEGCGYVVLLDGVMSASTMWTAEAIDEHWLAAKADRLREARSFMVVVTGPPRGALVEASARSLHVVTSLGDVDLLAVVERHALGPAPDAGAKAALRRRLAESNALTLLTEERPEPQVAIQVATAVRDDEDLARTVTALRDPTGQVHAWFGQHRDVESICMAIAAAVLEDGHYLAFSDAAVRLYEALTPTTGAPPDLRFWEQLSAGHPWIEVVTGDGPAPPRVRFRNPLVQQAVLAYVWTNLDGRRPALLDWLRDLVTDRNIGVRARAAVAAGVIAWCDHGHAVRRYLRSWALDRSWALRQGAATALAVMGADPGLTAATWRLLESWAHEDETEAGRRLAATAVTAVGGHLGGAQPERALRLIRQALDGEGFDTLLPAALSLARLVELGRTTEVLNALLEWSEPQDSSPLVAKALGIFATVTCEPPTTVADEDAGLVRWRSPGDGPPPLLLAQARDHLPQLAELWARALARKPAQTYALEKLRDCLEAYADHDPAIRRNLTAVLAEVATRPGRHRERLAWHLGEWARDDDRPSSSAAHLRDALARTR
ncbi:hypothetical protein [Actinoallomurus soli]|uniref:hypothetical protein n=1 Tax=Actinoallomurus soli TaxID=2952535 RepID=UPI0020932E8C|nr:hypothetical protein [Actinoallomurus soli]MCO5968313.1 hypothetical protein [Actinoallomurus soli]